MVKDPLYDYEFNLNTLHMGGNKDYNVEVTEPDQYTYLLNVCGPLNSGSGECADGKVGACQTKPTDTNFKPVKTGETFQHLPKSCA